MANSYLEDIGKDIDLALRNNQHDPKEFEKTLYMILDKLDKKIPIVCHIDDTRNDLFFHQISEYLKILVAKKRAGHATSSFVFTKNQKMNAAALSTGMIRPLFANKLWHIDKFVKVANALGFKLVMFMDWNLGSMIKGDQKEDNVTAFELIQTLKTTMPSIVIYVITDSPELAKENIEMLRGFQQDLGEVNVFGKSNLDPEKLASIVIGLDERTEQ